MAILLKGKIVKTIVVLAVIGRLTATNISIDKDSIEYTTTESPTTTLDGTTVVVDPPEDMLYKVGVGIADVTGPCVEINLVNILKGYNIY